MSAASKEELHRLIDALPESEHDTAARVLTARGVVSDDYPRYTLEAAPFDDEEEIVSDEDARALQEARREADAGERVPAQVVFDRFSL